MMFFPSREVVEDIRRNYPAGSRVELVGMDDPHAPPAGTHGTVMAVDDSGTIHVSWDNRSTLGIVFGVDSCRKI